VCVSGGTGHKFPQPQFDYGQGHIMAGNLTRFDPFGDIARFEPLRNIDDLFRDFRMMPGWRGMEPEPRIRMDMSETDQAYMVKAEIPGAKKEDIKVSIDGNEVTISAEVQQKEETNTGNMLRSERYYGQQYRSFSLPQDVDDEKAEARYQDGVLELTLPKKPGTGGKQLSIQ
jgi:HSP20 family protein